MYLQSLIMSQISRKNSFGKVVFPFLVGNFMSRDGNWFIGRHFVIVYPIFDFFAVFWFFWITLSVARISPPNSFGKVGAYFSELGSIGTPPLEYNGSRPTQYLDHLSGKELIKARGGGGYSSMIWIGTCRWDLKNVPMIPNFAEKWDPFLYQIEPPILSKIY